MRPDQPDFEPTLHTDLEWRPLAVDDAPAVAALTHRCLDADGGLREIAVSRFLAACVPPCEEWTSLGAFAPDGLRGCGTVYRKAGKAECRGQVDPLFRDHGLGRKLLEWSLVVASSRARGPGSVTISTESLTEAAGRLYRRFGLTQVFAEQVMRRMSDTDLPVVAMPAGISLCSWSHAPPGEFFQAYNAAFRERPGFPGWTMEEWTGWATGDDDFLPELSLLARENNVPVGFILCASGWIVQMGVHPSARRRGLGRVLLTEALRRFHALGTPEVWLDVNVNNPTAAALYADLGFQAMGRRARYAPKSL